MRLLLVLLFGLSQLGYGADPSMKDGMVPLEGSYFSRTIAQVAGKDRDYENRLTIQKLKEKDLFWISNPYFQRSAVNSEQGKFQILQFAHS